MARLPVNQPYTVTTQFGVPDSNAKFGKHSGIDYAVPAGRPVYAPAGGQLTNIVSQTGGNMVVIYDGRYYHRLMHNSSFSRGNGRVNEGEEVARAGTTGLSTGPHVHWDVNSQGTYPDSFSRFIDPNVWLKEGQDMPLVDETQDKLIKMSLGRDPTAGELSDSNWRNDPNLAIRSLWENGGKQRFGAKVFSASDTQIDTTISNNFQLILGKAPTDADFNTWRPLFKNNYVEALLEMERQFNANPDALKNQPKEYEKLPFDTFKKKGT